MTDLVYAHVCCLQQLAGVTDLLSVEPRQRAFPCVLTEECGEVAGRVAGVAGHLFKREPPLHVLQHVVLRSGNDIVGG